MLVKEQKDKYFVELTCFLYRRVVHVRAAGATSSHCEAGRNTMKWRAIWLA